MGSFVKKNFIIVALDISSKKKALELVDLLGNNVNFYKVGMQLFFSVGPSIIKELKKRKKKVFLDLKLNDIPNTLKNAIITLEKHDVDYLTLFCSPKVLATLRTELIKLQSNLALLNIAKLTSEVRQKGDQSNILNLTKTSLVAGASGVVCSGLETSFLRNRLGKNFIIINPGVRLETNKNKDDQQAIVTPVYAYMTGATHIVLGRPILESNDPSKTVRSILSSLPKK